MHIAHFGRLSDEPPHELSGEALADPVFTGLFESWRTPDADALVPLCLAACDYHSYRCQQGDKSSFFKFERMTFTRTPNAMLVLFRLRAYLGLENPAIDHPLMNSPSGTLLRK